MRTLEKKITHGHGKQKTNRITLALTNHVTANADQSHQTVCISPKCRYEYSREKTPSRYYCYCGKEAEPAPDPWLLPHSCGQVCEREFKPSCGHRCLLLCHPGTPDLRTVCSSQVFLRQVDYLPLSIRDNKDLPAVSSVFFFCLCVCVSGPCPPCPKMVSVSCLCGKSSRVPRRCSAKSWSCRQICGRTLPCRIHSCADMCHAGQCSNSKCECT